MRKAIVPARYKAGTDDLGEGQFEALVAVFGNVDLGGDRIMPGAFTDTLAEWKASGDPIPVIWSHRWEDPDYHIGEVLEAKETERGLVVSAQLDLDMPKAATTFRLLKGRRVKQFSFSYDVDEERESEDDRANELVKLGLIEVGPTLAGMNPSTELGTVKSDAAVRALLNDATRALDRAKAGRVLSSNNEKLLRDAHANIGSVLAKLDEQDDQGESGKSGTYGRDPLTLRTTLASLEDELADVIG